ncbi:MAG: NAD(P)/FAD-dependent oxidoreductase [Treponema sp.]|jgi:glycerol-3-phosphate dehydrogenase|nr:NAD(P)/FAD-dependent oxidoreductase [Treponema sp.]
MKIPEKKTCLYDVVIIGGGVCGCSLLYALSRYNVRAVLVEKENDLAAGASRANSGIIHAGYDPEPGTLMAKYNAAGNPLMYEICAALDVPHKKTGSLVLAFDQAGRQTIEKLYAQGVQNGVPDMKILEYGELHAREPRLNKDARCALFAGTAGVVSPWEFAIAQAEAAVQGGAEVLLDTEVRGVTARDGGGFSVAAGAGSIEARFVVNAAGLNAGAVSGMIEPAFFTIRPKRGQYFLMDASQAFLTDTVLFQCPNENGKGTLVAPTAHGNLIAGPDSERVSGDDRANTAGGLAFVREAALRTIPALDFAYSIRNFSGVRADSDHPDFIIGESEHAPGFFNIAGIKSPGLTSSPAIARDMVVMLEKAGLLLAPNPRFVSKRKVIRFKQLPREARQKLLSENPRYGAIVCRCETVTEGEILEAFKRPLPPRSLDAVKRRCGAGMGRCQGGFCGPRVLALISRELGVPPREVPLDRKGMYLITGETKTSKGART